MIPPRSILATVDFSEHSRIALMFAARLARHCHGQLHVLHAEDRLLHAAAKARGIDLTSETREELGRFMLSAYPAGDWAPIHHVIAGDAKEVISDIAQREQVDLIVMGMHGMSGPARAMFGSTTEGVLRSAAISVVAVPGTWAPPREDADDLSGLGPVVAGIESTTPSLEAAAAGVKLALALGTSLELVHVVPPLAVLERWRAHADDALADRVAAAREELSAAVRALGTEVPISLDVASGPVAERLAQSVEPSPGRDPILVLGRRAHTIRREAPGTTAYRVLTLARVPVLVYLPPE